MSLDYSTFVATIANECVVDSANADFQQILPQAIAYGEAKCYNELDLLGTLVRDTSSTCTANSRNFTLPQSLGVFQTVDRINVVTPVSTTINSGGTRNPVVPVNAAWVDTAWPSETAASATTIPTNFAMNTDQTVIFGPPPGAAFQVEVVGFIIPTPLSATNTTTYLTTYFPSLFTAACMIFMAGWQQNFGNQSDNPQMAMSWMQIYNDLFKSCSLVDARQKFASAGWTSAPPETLAQLPR